MQSLSLSKPLDGILNLVTLESICRRLAGDMAGRLKEEGMVYQEVSLQADTGEGTVISSGVFAHYQSPPNLQAQLIRLLSRLRLAAPVEKLTVTVAGLAPAPVDQATLFNVKDPLCSNEKLRRAIRELERKHRVTFASSLATDRRESVLSFFDPLRQQVRAVDGRD